MQTFGNYLRANLPEWTKRVEDRLEVQIGPVDVRPLPDFGKEVMVDVPDTRLGNFLFQISVTPLLYVVDLMGIVEAKAGKSTIYYSRSPFVDLTTNRHKTQTGLHELVHIGHKRILEGNGYRVTDVELNIPAFVMEGFADYVTRDIMGFLCMQYDSNYITNLAYRHLRRFESELSAKGINDIGHVKQFVAQFH